MTGFASGKAWGKSVNKAARADLLGNSADTAADLKRAIGKAEQLALPFQIADWNLVDRAWIINFFEGVRSAENGVDTWWRAS
jgi:hypothetical protein